MPEDYWFGQGNRKNGVSVSLGRTLPNLTLLPALGLSGFIVAENGGILWDGPRKRGIEPMANGKRCRDAIEWLASKMGEIDQQELSRIGGGRLSVFQAYDVIVCGPFCRL